MVWRRKSQPSVYRILKAHNLVTADSKFKHPTQYVNELWQPILPSSKSWVFDTVLGHLAAYAIVGATTLRPHCSSCLCFPSNSAIFKVLVYTSPAGSKVTMSQKLLTLFDIFQPILYIYG